MLKKSLAVLALFFALGALVIYLLHPAYSSHRPTLLTPAYVERGNQAEKNFRSYNELLAGYYKSLASALGADAPDLLPLLQAPDPIKSGYQILPRLSSDVAPAERSRNRSASYSWPWTERLIETERRKLGRSEDELRYTTVLNQASRRRTLEALALDYRRLYAKLRNIDAHVRYNSFWQAAIAADRAAYDRETALHDEVLERQEVRAELRNLSDSALSAAAPKPTGPFVGLARLTGDLRKREAFLTQRIDGAIAQLETPPYVTMEHRPHEWIFRVPLYTDIEDRAFVASVKTIIETTWQLKDGENTYRVELEAVSIPAEVLYTNSERPAAGQPIDVLQHLRRFPASGAVLTTGALTTHVQNNAIVLGPQAIAPRVLAHEFGHILGFRDRYVRGYWDLGADGFEVLEVIANPEDIMAVPTTGAVLLSHFEMLLKSTGAVRAKAQV